MRESMYNILICDDEKDIVNALKIYLNDTNYHFLEAFDGEEAVHLVETNEVHLVLMLSCFSDCSARRAIT